MAHAVLLVEDDDVLREVVAHNLASSGFSVLEARSVAEATEAWQRADVVVLDWMLPGMDGIDVCRALKADPSTAAAPVVFLTAASHEGAHDEARAAGAIGVIAKPFSPMALGASLEALLAGR